MNIFTFFTLNSFWWITECCLEFKELISENSIKIEKSVFMLECTISHKVNWYFGSDYISIANKLLEKFIQIALRKRKKTGYCAIFKL